MKIAIFDFDGTLFPIDTLRYLLSCWKSEGLSKYKYYKAYSSLIGLFTIYKIGRIFKLPNHAIRNKALQSFNNIFKGMHEEEVVKYLDKCAEGIIKLLNPLVVEEVRKAKEEGFHLILLSGTYELLLKNIAKYLEMDRIIATEMYFNNGIFDQSVELDIISGPKKLEQLNKYIEDKDIDLELSRAFADSYTDIHLLKAVGTAVAVCPDERLREYAIGNGWRIIT